MKWLKSFIGNNRRAKWELNSELLDAARSGSVAEEWVGKLLSEGADTNAVDRATGMTPLHHAAMYDNASVVQLLLQAGANKEAIDIYGQTPLHTAASWAYAWNTTSIVDVFVKAGANKEAKPW